MDTVSAAVAGTAVAATAVAGAVAAIVGLRQSSLRVRVELLERERDECRKELAAITLKLEMVAAERASLQSKLLDALIEESLTRRSKTPPRGSRR